MLRKFRILTVAVIATSLATGSLAAAAPAFAADKALGPNSYDVRIEHPEYGHYDALRIKPASRETVIRQGVKLYRTYTVTAERESRRLLHYKVGATKALQLTYESRLQEAYHTGYKTDAAFQAHLRGVFHGSVAQAAAKAASIKPELKNRYRVTELYTDVAQTTVNLATWVLDGQDPSAFPSDQIVKTLPDNETVTFTFTPVANAPYPDFLVVGKDLVTKKQVVFDSRTNDYTLEPLK